MSTPQNADFNAGLSAYHAALFTYQQLLTAIEDDARKVQSDGRVALENVNTVTLTAGSRATCVVRATVDAKILKLDLDTHAQPKNDAVLNATVTALDARLSLLQDAVTKLNAARKVLDEQLAAILASGHTALEALKACQTPETK